MRNRPFASKIMKSRLSAGGNKLRCRKETFIPVFSAMKLNIMARLSHRHVRKNHPARKVGARLSAGEPEVDGMNLCT